MANFMAGETDGTRNMTQSEFDSIIANLDSLSPEQRRQLRRALDQRIAAPTQLPVGQAQGSLGAMRDAADELDAIVEQAMKNREERPWRLSPGE
jgi:hypothetical protein